jgi:hypothetical protein
MARSRRVADMDFGIAQRALESLATTFDDFGKHQAYELEDALDVHLTEPVSGEAWFGLVAALREAIYQQGGRFAPGDRFSSFEEMSQWVMAAAEERGFKTVLEDPDPDAELRWLHVETPVGELGFSFYGGAMSVRQPTDDGTAGRLVRELLRSARALQDAA